MSKKSTCIPPVDLILLLISLPFEIFVTYALKNLHHSSRPFWVNFGGTVSNNTGNESAIVPSKCISEYGNPSGHSFFAIYFSMYLFFQYIYSNNLKTFELNADDTK